MGFVSSPRTATMRPSCTSTRSPQLWLQRTHTVGRFVPLSVIVPPPSDMPGPAGVHVPCGHRLAAVLAGEAERRHVPAAAVHALDGRPLPAGHVPVAPSRD